ncbi:hypothetical protein JCM24511_06167 [Saitozyma sp. JCM 24511]|nr:hypothetical protein JCM24511_06167 [Saitozyma sp. JCM 24511]
MKLPKHRVYFTGLAAPKLLDSLLGWLTHGRLRTLRIFAKYCPLIAAVLAPLSTLLDIPALTEPWFTLNGVPVRDFRASLVLSAVGLALNILANALLVIRFSSSKEKRWRRATLWSTLCWLGALIVEIINIAMFGPHRHRTPDYQPTEGFWCAVVSLMDAGVICIALVLHFALDFSFGTIDDDDETELRLQGRKFMLSVTFFLLVIGFQAFAYSRLEGWLFSDAIYFSIQCALTIGYGDLVPTNTWGKILVFPFFILTISQLANEVLIIFGFIKDRADQRRDQWRKRYEAEMHAEANAVRPNASVLQEMALIQEINKREEMKSQLYDLIWSALALFVFWVSGAAIFHAIEDWSYGNATYAVVILTTTIGFGDFVPTAPIGRVVWIPYTLMAVPIITSFAGQTIAGVMSNFFRPAWSEDAIERTRMACRALRVQDKPDDAAKAGAIPACRTLSIDNANPYPHNRGASTHPPLQHRPDYFAFHPKPHSSSVEPQVTRIALKDAAEEQSSPEGREDHTVTAQKRKVQSDHHTVELIVKAKVDEDDPSQLGTRGDAGMGGPDGVPGRGEGTCHMVHEENVGLGTSRSKGPTSPKEAQECDDQQTGEAIKDAAEEGVRELEARLLRKLVELMVRLETEARQMLLDSMEKGLVRTLLLADRNVQIRDVRALRSDDADVLAIWSGNTEQSQLTDRTDGVLQQAWKYRNTFAEILVVGGLLEDLQGEQLGVLERCTGLETLGEEEVPWGKKPTEVEGLAQTNWVGNVGSVVWGWLAKLKRGLDWAFGG